MEWALLAALFIGLRHATDPDHLTALASLVLYDRNATRRAGVLGLCWGSGHATTLFVLGLPVALLGARLPNVAHNLAEFAIGALIAGLAARLLVRWHRGVLHAHAHTHGDVRHTHPHAHDRAHPAPGAPPMSHQHEHTEALGRSPLAAYGIGLLHGAGGSAAAGVLIAAAPPDPVQAAATLAVFALGTALSMAVLSTGFGFALEHDAIARRVPALVPPAGAVGVLFGLWYALSAIGLDIGA